MEKEMKVPLIVVKSNDDDYDDNEKDNIEISISQDYEKFYMDNSKPPHNSKKITKIVCSSNTKYVVTFSEEDKSIHGWPIDGDDDDDDNEIKEGKELHYNSRFQKDELKDLLMVSNDRYALVRISGKEQDEFRIIKLDENENEIFYVKGNPACDQGTFISSTNDFFIIYKKELEAYVYCTSQVIVNKKREMDSNEHNKDITTTWQLKSKYKFVFPQQFWQNEERPTIGFYLTPEKLFLTYKGSNILSQWDLTTMTFEKQYLLELNKRNVHPCVKVDDDDIFEIKQSMVVDGTKKNIMAIHGYSTFNYEHQIIVYNMKTELKISSFTLPSENSTSNISIVGTSENDGGMLIYGFKNGEERPEYFLHDLNNLDFCENAQAISSVLPDHVDAQLVVNKEMSDKIVIAKDSKLLVFNINDRELRISRDRLKLKKLIRDQTDKTFKYYPYPYPTTILTTILMMLEGLNWNISADLPAEYTCYELDTIKWSVNHWKKTGKTSIKVSELVYDEKSAEWKDLDEFKYFPPREIFVFACKCIENGDLIMITKQGIRIFTIIRPKKKIRMRYFWDNEYWREAWKSSKKLETPFNFDDARRELYRCEKLPPLDITRLIELYETFYIENNSRVWPFKDLLRNYLQDTSTLAGYGKKVLYKAIDAKKGNIVELICNMCTNFLEKDPDNFYLLRIIVKCLPKLQQNYPEIVAEFMAKSSMILDHQCFIATNSEQNLVHGYSRDVMIYEKNTFWDHYHKIQFFYYKFYNIIKNVIETISGDEDEEKFGIPVVVFLIPLYKFSSFSPKFNLYYDVYNPKSNAFVDLHYPAFYKEWNAEALLNFKWNTYGKYYYYTNWTWFLIYLLIFALGTTLSDTTLSLGIRKALLSITIVIGFVFFTFEIRDFVWRPRRYLRNFWNLFDCGAYLFPIATSVYWLKYGQPPLWLPTFANLLVDLKFLLFFRVFESYGRYFAIILGVAKHVFSFVMILFIIILSFAHAFYILLRPQQPYVLTNPTVNNDVNNPWSLTDQFYQMNPDGTIGQNPIIVKQPDSSTNMFAWPQTSLLAMYLLLIGDQNSLQSFTYLERHSLALLIITFSFFTVIYLMNLFIGLLNNAIEVNNDHANYLIEKSRIIAEIELFYLFPHQRRWRTWFPDIIYYEVPVDEVRKQIHLLDTTQSSSTYSPIISSRLRDIVDMPKSYNEQQQDLLSKFDAINKFFKKINLDGYRRQFSVSSLGSLGGNGEGSKQSKPGTPGTRDIKMYFASDDVPDID
ncbi:hypothetical protein C1645_731803 [Glomus cerebriforme]|uniref:Ion transport domain-containing protein n=1 Tax=Glomus cerebriforme TaxID=658196 RepID=A0A397TJ54_9GLOM|nr:hypothetical protein C1645_731803 [Glomus cerebriforme]